MKKFILLSFSILTIFQLSGQSDSLSQLSVRERNRAIQHLLDYRFRGGSGAFEKYLFEYVDYPTEARQKCIIGTTILIFTVDCDNNMSELRIRNPLHPKINDQLRRFYNATEGMWNHCEDQKYTRFEIPVLFIVGSTETTANAFIRYETEAEGMKCRSDAWHMEQYEKMKAKNKIKQALRNLDILIQRDPYNQTYYELKRGLLTNE